ncbi:MAG: WD40/YVTN/BNR-like repeat-containing protein, partial [Planctomycetota bacterium]
MRALIGTTAGMPSGCLRAGKRLNCLVPRRRGPVAARRGAPVRWSGLLALILLGPSPAALGQTGYIAGNGGTILKTTDGGANWNHFPVDATTGYAVGNMGVILKTTDGGANWNSQDSGGTISLRDVCFPVDATTGYVTGSVGTILKTTDGGSNWNVQTSGTTEVLRAVHFPIDTMTGFAAGHNGTILK